MKARTNDIISYHTVCCHWNPKSRSMDCWLNQPVNHSDVGITVAVYYMTIVCGFTWLYFMLLKTKPLFLCHATLVGIQNNIIGNQFKTRSARLRFLPGEASILDWVWPKFFPLGANTWAPWILDCIYLHLQCILQTKMFHILLFQKDFDALHFPPKELIHVRSFHFQLLREQHSAGLHHQLFGFVNFLLHSLGKQLPDIRYCDEFWVFVNHGKPESSMPSKGQQTAWNFGILSDDVPKVGAQHPLGGLPALQEITW